MITYMKIVGIIVYLVLAAIALNIRLTDYRIDEHCKPYEYEREPKPLDVWISVLWPFWFCVCLSKQILLLLHTVMGYALFMFNIKYIKTERFKRINRFLE